MPKRSAMLAKPVCSAARLTARSAALNTTRMKKWPVSTSLNCWASRMFCPLWARNVETADTMSGRSGQDNVNTNGWSGIGARGYNLDEDGTAICGPALSPAAPLRQSRRRRQDEQTDGERH